MAIDHLEETRELPYDREAIVAGGAALADYVYELVKTLSLEQLREINLRINALLDLNTIDFVYFSTPSPETGLYASGTWRIGINDDGHFVKQKYDGSTWVTVTEENA